MVGFYCGKNTLSQSNPTVAVQAHLGYQRAKANDLNALAGWLLERALEHDKPTLLYEQLCEKLRADQLLRPGVTRLERLVAEARARAQTETSQQLTPLLTKDRKQWLDSLLQPDPTRGLTPLTWLRRAANANSPRAILDNLDKLTFLRPVGVEGWALEMLNPNRLKFLAQVARKSNAHTLQRAVAERRYPLLVAFLSQALADVADEVIEMFDRCLAEAYGRAGQDLEDFRKAMAHATNEKVHLFRELAYAVLDPAIADPNLRSAIYQRITPSVLRRAAAESDRIVRPLDDSYFDFFETRYGYLRQFTPAFLATFTFHANQNPAPLLEAVELLHQLNATHRRKETELTILEHATDTAGYTDVVFCLFDLLGMQFAPRLRDLGDQQLYRLSREQQTGRLAPRFKGTIQQDFIVRHWDDMLRLAGSLKRGGVTASLFISKLQASPRQNVLTRALQEYGRLVKTRFILHYLLSSDYRRRINTQLNKGESLHALRDFLFMGDKGVIRRKQYEAQTNLICG
jgi:hypothetical protein